MWATGAMRKTWQAGTPCVQQQAHHAATLQQAQLAQARAAAADSSGGDGGAFPVRGGGFGALHDCTGRGCGPQVWGLHPAWVWALRVARPEALAAPGCCQALAA
ncbi:hypothetical protein PLESTB_001672900 [Pleodorina starrii]|uniref:Uncharacterized protein n=1 Tax=Pleodorina starrii TaxID=330485 RepID=A0A9W6BZT4_9CHLO|nr:hypothetical protein PLESTM_000430200 [Pleodorina starrii]GLC53673.1 hypothetical protein PLESTB_000775000 [Pleodorina starrii]GLC60805.1 hypothetical protein PLESTB_001672900 [Pleodorina starrii]